MPQAAAKRPPRNPVRAPYRRGGRARSQPRRGSTRHLANRRTCRLPCVAQTCGASPIAGSAASPGANPPAPKAFLTLCRIQGGVLTETPPLPRGNRGTGSRPRSPAVRPRAAPREAKRAPCRRAAWRGHMRRSGLRPQFPRGAPPLPRNPRPRSPARRAAIARRLQPKVSASKG